MTDRVFLTTDQALSMLPEGDTIHTFRGGGILIGADWSRAEVEEVIRAKECELGGDMCQGMNHGLVVHDHGPIFVECKRGIDYASYEVRQVTPPQREGARD